ncbi:MAG: hypothetical protein HFJ45_07605 [Clostridia bacterium]|nr:hypothetical protein [Clostridia bacterium]
MEVSSSTENINVSFEGANCRVINKKTDYCSNKLANGKYVEWYSILYYCEPTSSSVKIKATNPNNYWMWFYSSANKIYE